MTRKTFDCVGSMRQIRDRISSEIAEMSYEQLSHWLGSHRYSDPVLERLARKPHQSGDAASAGSRRR
jgi:hypothetical protein